MSHLQLETLRLHNLAAKTAKYLQHLLESGFGPKSRKYRKAFKLRTKQYAKFSGSMRTWFAAQSLMGSVTRGD